MDKIVIKGGKKLKGEVTISGAKNAVLPIMAAALLAEGTSRIEGIPSLQDVGTMVKLLRVLGAKVNLFDHAVEINAGNGLKSIAPYHLVSNLRGSGFVLGPLLARLGRRPLFT